MLDRERCARDEVESVSRPKITRGRFRSLGWIGEELPLWRVVTGARWQVKCVMVWRIWRVRWGERGVGTRRCEEREG